MKRLMPVLAIVLILVLALAGCSTGSKNRNTITVGVAGPMTGDGAEYGKAMADGVQLAADEINAAGGINGKQIVLRVEDDKGDPNQAAIVAQRLVDSKEVAGVIGHFSSSATAAAIPTYQKGGMPVVAPTPSNPALIKLPDHTFIFRTADSQQMEGQNLADLFVNKLGKKKIAILYADTDYGKANHQYLVENLQKMNATLTYDKSYTPGSNVDFQSPLTAIRASKPDLIYFSTEYNDAVLLIRQAREMGIKSEISVSGIDYANEFLKQGGKDVEGVYLDTLFFPDSPDPRDKAFISAFNKKYSRLPGIQESEPYEAAKVLFEAVKRAGPDRGKIRDALENMKDFVAFNRPVSFSSTNHNSFNTHYVNLIVKNGQFTAFTK